MKKEENHGKKLGYEENVRRQLSILNALGKDYLTLCLLNIKTETIAVLNTEIEEIKDTIELPYYEVCSQSIDKYVREDQKEDIKKKINLEMIRKELDQNQEYSVSYEVSMNGKIQYYQMRYISMEDHEHVLMTFRILKTKKDDGEEKQSKAARALRKERLFLEVLCRDYTSVYYFDLKSDTCEILKMDENANAVNMFGTKLRQKLSYTTEIKRYCDCYVIEKDQAEFSKVMAKENIWKALKNEERSKRLEKEKQDAINANEMKSRFLSSISHDIRTPINGILGMLRIADTYSNDLKKQTECREKIWIASNYLVTLVNNVLNMNRLENKSIDLSEQSFNIIDLLMDITGMTEIQMQAQGLHSIVDWKPEYIKHRYLMGSAEGLYRILMNLNSNAIKYNKKGGTIYFRCMEKQIEGDKIWFEFITEDTGIGMDEEFLKNAFEPYIQKDNTTLNSIKGVGLGLSIVKQTVELMDGSIKVESKLSEGTKYTIMLPFKIDKYPKVEKKSFEHIPLKGVKALLVEDNDLNMEIAKFHLEQEDVEVYTAINGAEAVEMFERSKIGFYDIILMDIMMPIMDGLQATKQIRDMNRPDALAIPIVAMSANAFEEDIKKSLESGMNTHLIKPLDGKKVTDTMKKYLANKIIK